MADAVCPVWMSLEASRGTGSGVGTRDFAASPQTRGGRGSSSWKIEKTVSATGA